MMNLVAIVQADCSEQDERRSSSNVNSYLIKFNIPKLSQFYPIRNRNLKSISSRIHTFLIYAK